MEFSWHKTDDKVEKVRHFLQHHGVSGRLFKQVTGQGQILINGQLAASTGALVTQADQVTIKLPPEKKAHQVTISTQPLKVIYADANWLVVDKPAGLSSIPGPTNQTDTLLNRVQGWLQQQNDTEAVPHVVTRLDRFTSGIVLLARHRFAHSLIAKQLQAHTIDKRYYAIVSGHLTSTHGFMTQPLGRQGDEIRRRVMADGKAAKTEYWQLEQLAAATFVEVKLYTGRTHQIRAHFTDAGHPLLGDQLYAGPLDLGITRQALHAYELSFYDPFTQQTMHFTSPLPADMQAVLASDN
ncbi:RluA family pseudouridine synthase [Loigolactobacillus jiayinensis]|uniref:Pseudouridine synthase n=1 Tax=Loigolactobacillus jiayinensis TaxID=2486016 RepID=A0ABW1REN4_9LACO|nr:RluA family pseudouridine synthase [Loigolactobacillus jiayinensis]